MRRTAYLALTLLLSLSISGLVSAECSKDCWQYCGPNGDKGYCTDYIKSKGKRIPGGNANQWPSNVAKSDVRQGDAAIFNSPAPYGHVAYVERVNYDRFRKPISIDVSEWNWGAKSPDPKKQACGVTQKYHIRTDRPNIPITSVSGFWR